MFTVPRAAALRQRRQKANSAVDLDQLRGPFVALTLNRWAILADFQLKRTWPDGSRLAVGPPFVRLVSAKRCTFARMNRDLLYYRLWLIWLAFLVVGLAYILLN
jgi:hypothetical protein